MPRALDALKPALRTLVENLSDWTTADALAERIGLEGRYRDRTVRLMIEDMIFTDGLAVIAHGEGFKPPRTWLEWLEYEQTLKDRIKGICQRKAQVRKNIYNLFHGQKVVRLI